MVPFPRSHLHAFGFPVDWSVKLTTNGAQPARLFPVKFAEGCAFTSNAEKRLNRSKTQAFVAVVNVVIGIGIRFKDRKRVD